MTFRRQLVLDPMLTDDEYGQVIRWKRWPESAAVLTCSTIMIAVILTLPLVVVPQVGPFIWALIITCAISWIIVMDHRVFHPIWSTRRLKRERRVICMPGGSVWDLYVIELNRIDNNVAECDRATLHNELFMTMRTVVCAEAVMENHGMNGKQPNVSAHQDALAARNAALANISKRIDVYDTTERA